MLMRLLSVFLCAASICSAADLVPAAKLAPARMREVNGTYGLGVPGGIPTGAGWTTVNIVPDGSDIGTPLQTALNTISPGEHAEKIFLLPAGNYSMAGISLPNAHKYIIRGPGSGLLNITATGGFDQTDIYPRFSNEAEGWAATTNIVASTLTRDTTTIQVANASQGGIVPFVFVMIELPNDYTDRIVLQPNSTNPRVRSQLVMITAVNTGTNEVSFTPPLAEDYSNLETLTGIPAQMRFDTSGYSVHINVGIEGMTLTASGGLTHMMVLYNMQSSWIQDVKIQNHKNIGIDLQWASQCEIRKVWVAKTGDTTYHSNQSGIRPSYTTNLLIEDCILELNFPCLEYWLTNTNSSFGYNFIPSAAYGIGWNCHNAHNSFLIAEGNIMPNGQAESYYGSNSEVVFHRNWIFGRDASGGSGVPGNFELFGINETQGSTMDLQRFNRNSAVVGNLLRAPGISTADGVGAQDSGHFYGWPYQYWTSFGDATPSTEDWWVDWDLTNDRVKEWSLTLTSSSGDTAVFTAPSTAVADDLEASLVAASGNGGSRERWWTEPTTNGTFGVRSGDTWSVSANSGATWSANGSTVTVWPGIWGFRERDHDVENTLTKRGNYNYFDDDIPPGEAIGADTLQDSVYRTAKPAWFGSIDWPVIDPTNPPAAFNQATISNMLPAAYRYYNGNEDYLGGVASPAPSPTPGTYSSTQGVTLTCATPDADIYYTLDGTTPTTSSTLYTGEISVSVTTTIKSFAVKDGLEDSSVTTSTYTISGGGGPKPTYNFRSLGSRRR